MADHHWKTGIIGCGKIAGLLDAPKSAGPVTTHAQAYFRHPRFQIVAAASPRLEDLKYFQQTWQVAHTYKNPELMLAEQELDVISICSPDDHHYAHALQVLDSPLKPKMILIEKPVCLTRSELQELQQKKQESGVTILVNHSRRFDPVYQKVSAFIQSNKLGKLVQGRGVYYGGWLHNGVHLIDTLLMLFARPLSVIASTFSSEIFEKDTELNASLLLDNAIIHIESFSENYFQLFELELLFETGRIRFLDFGARIYLEEVTTNTLGERELKEIPSSPWKALNSPLAHAVDTIDRCLSRETAEEDTGADLSQTEKTMDVLWQALDKADRLPNMEKGNKG